jgi:biopolymer transport protein ExbB/biopolymer transport protein TolQ
MDWRAAVARHAAERTAAVERWRMARGLACLGTVAATAPFVGAFGAVAGVVHQIGYSSACFGVGLGDLSETCWIAEFGLAVGILASWGYRHLSARMAGFDVEMRSAALALPDQLAACGFRL